MSENTAKMLIMVRGANFLRHKAVRQKFELIKVIDNGNIELTTWYLTLRKGW